MRRTIKLRESELRRMISKSLKRVLKEHYRDYPRNEEELERTMDDAKRFLRDYSYGSFYKDYTGPSVTITNGDSIVGVARYAYEMYDALKYQNCRDRKLMTAMKSFIEHIEQL